MIDENIKNFCNVVTEINKMNNYLDKMRDDFYSGGYGFETIYKLDIDRLNSLEDELRSSMKQLITKDEKPIISPNVVDQVGISEDWMELWDDVELWYGDIRRSETGKQFLERQQKKFILSKINDDENS